jgi:hypothetical protein
VGISREALFLERGIEHHHYHGRELRLIYLFGTERVKS